MLYHFQTGFPKGMPTSFGIIPLRYSRHAIQASQNDRYGFIDLPPTLDTKKAKLIEIEVTEGVISKVVYRHKHCRNYDLVMVIIPQGGIVKTVWLNSNRDKHNTLNRKKYSKPY